jgi:hypothetical protein
MVTDDQAKALAEIYTWDMIISILVESRALRTTAGQSAADRVIAIAKAQQKKLISVYEKEKTHGI